MLKKLKDRLKNRLKNSKGFSLIELIVVIAIMVILIALLVPNVIGYISSANDTAKAATASSIYTATAQSIATYKSKNITDDYTPFPAEAGDTDTNGYDIRFLVSGTVEWSKIKIYFNDDLSSVVAVEYGEDDDAIVYPGDYADEDAALRLEKIKKAGAANRITGVAKGTAAPDMDDTI